MQNNIPNLTQEEFRDGKAGYIWVPYITKTVKTTINNTTVWHSNKFINFLLKIKFFFWKPKDLKIFEKYSKKTVNTKYYATFKIEK